VPDSDPPQDESAHVTVRYAHRGGDRMERIYETRVAIDTSRRGRLLNALKGGARWRSTQRKIALLILAVVAVLILAGLGTSYLLPKQWQALQEKIRGIEWFDSLFLEGEGQASLRLQAFYQGGTQRRGGGPEATTAAKIILGQAHGSLTQHL
jgi:4-amino-4-deoxy-L-arabinose transferase-like glycosyltransferase